jgi:RNA methyltransferase, TrmH family
VKEPRVREIPICGFKAVQAVFSQRPEAVVRLFFDAASGRRAGSFSKWMAAQRRVYRQVTPEELIKIAGTMHHGGIVAITTRAAPHPATPEDAMEWAQTGAPLLVLDRIGNAHNLGAIVRSAAFFAIDHVVYGESPGQALPGEAAYRVAEGGMEHVELHPVADLPAFLRAIRPGYELLGAALDGTPVDWRARSVDRRPPAIVLGNEETGLAPETAAACERRVLIPGSGRVESLNVSAAAAALLAWTSAVRR